MAKKTSRSNQPAPSKGQNSKAQEKETQEEALHLNDVSDSSSEEELSSDDEIEMEGLEHTTTNVKASKKGHTVNLTKAEADAPSKSSKKRGVIYIGRLPKSFQEYELKKYFSQFGDILKVRVSRNKKTGASRHYGFIEFKDYEVAKVAADTMNNYLLVGHLLKVHVIENPSDNLFSKKMKSNFREFDWRAKEYAEFHQPKPLEEWKKLQAEFEQKKEEKFAELKTLGFDYALEA
ncbi:putative ribosome biogenesis protein [Clavispora lusitaniae]|uniref:RRM domain-containing protein n=2 Tax=Clavispora lusitaniae TaxID=36911 RepID=C4Y2U8_CLAL4|nr:uncharacterized protein CLUG_02861 [Clavispora lusitaniae ATCC 42720]KAF7579888.1 RNA recognition motif family protein [Clavispora lusitaniae]EEQ38735.1 hypothetical protein CLUG_02861 [Clavispora lusitaniae ATCC 42720]QFZ27441.1 putative ribosome biogenesis protein [Clavispora lusitaniae]QFZ33251.1 putative ribosome biogenesis protein [Clavispora lusitaniae]QFZ38922.1 putative ribosome biogenesis protein [Clavispora lusitaniae]